MLGRMTWFRVLLALCTIAVPALAAPAGWRDNPPPADPGAMAPRLSQSSSGSLLTWIEPAGDQRHSLRMSRFRGSAWQPPVTIAEGGDLLANWADTPVVAEGGDGALYAAWPVEIGRGSGVKVARSVDSGATWKALGWLHADRSEAEHSFVSFAAEGRGVRAFWLGGENAEKAGGATVLRTAWVGESIRDERLLDDRVCDCCSTGAARGAHGLLVAFRDRAADELRDIVVGRFSATGFPTSPAAADGWKLLGCPVNGPEIAASGEQAAVAWFTAADNRARVEVAFSKDGGATFASPARIDGGRPLGRVGIVLAAGDAVVSWLEASGEKAEIRLRRVLPDGRAGDPVTVAAVPATHASGVPRLLADGDRLLVVWTDPAPGGQVLAGGTLPLTAIPRPR
jgi:hypothetical protein